MSNLLEINNSLNSIIELIEEFDGSIIDATEQYNNINGTSLTEDQFVELFNSLEQDKLTKVRAYILKSKELKSNIVLYKDMQDKYKANVNRVNNTLDFMKNNLLITMKNSNDEKIKTDVGTVYIKNTESVDLKEDAVNIISNALQEGDIIDTQAISFNYNFTLDEVKELIDIATDRFINVEGTIVNKLYSKFELKLDKTLAKEELKSNITEKDKEDTSIYPFELYNLSKNQSLVGL